MQHELEKYNNVMTKDYFRSTAHQGEQVLIQIIQKQNRIEYLRDTDENLPKHHEIKCTNCSAAGHNKTSCTSECKYCKFSPFKDHLSTINEFLVVRRTYTDLVHYSMSAHVTQCVHTCMKLYCIQVRLV